MNCELIQGDALKELVKIPNDSVDLCLTDPPYGLEFMGKEWDKWGDSFTEKWASAVLPKLKDGAFLVFTMSPRQDLLWRCLAGLEKAGFELKSSGMYWLYHTGFPKACDMSKQIDKRKGLKGEIINPKTYPDIRSNNYGNSQGKTRLSGGDYVSESEEARKWQGWKSFSLKPSVECIVVAQKPRSEKTIVGQVLATGTGAVNVGDCRIPYASERDKYSYPQGGQGKHANPMDWDKPAKRDTPQYSIEQGRFPANLLVSGEPLKGESNRFYSLDAWAEKNNITLSEESAFFDVPKPSKAEKNKGLDGFEEKQRWGKGGVGTGISARENIKAKNVHPTTKPVKLFCYLAKLFCQPNGVVLDPFMGSGTTGIACLQGNFNFIGIEKEAEYFEIAKARIKPFKEQTKLEEEGN